MTIGIKHDSDKLRYDLVQPVMLEQLAKALHNGAKKYGDQNYKFVENHRYVAALMRHLQAYRKGEEADHDSGLHPLAHVMACAAILLQKELEANPGMKKAHTQTVMFSDEELNEMEEEFLKKDLDIDPIPW